MVDLIRGLIGKIHNATCPGALMNVKPVQKLCPVCDDGG